MTYPDEGTVERAIVRAARDDVWFRLRYSLVPVVVLTGAIGFLGPYVLPLPYAVVATSLLGLATGFAAAYWAQPRLLPWLCRQRGHVWRPWNPFLPPARTMHVCRRCGAQRDAAVPREHVITEAQVKVGPDGRVYADTGPLGVLKPGERLSVDVFVRRRL